MPTARFRRAKLPEDPDELGAVLEDRSVFGRVSPQQKRAIVGALQRRGHVVAMTGDGVNDALALKDADIGIAMGSGAPATRAVAQVVLLDGRFASMPSVVAEGRRVIANVERVANLFVTKTVYAMILAVVIGIARWPYPFLPRHLTIVSSLTIGIPAFFLALAPNSRYVPGFVRRVVLFAGPAGLIAAVDLRAVRDRTPLRGRCLADRGDDHAAHHRSVGVEPACASNHAGAGLAVRRDGRRVLDPILVWPVLRSWFALEIPAGAAMWGAVTSALAGGFVLEVGWQIRQMRLPPELRTVWWAWRGDPSVTQSEA